MRTRIKPRRTDPRRGPARSPEYLAWIRTLPCIVTGEVAEAAHTGPHGLGQRASDYQAIPLAPRLHRWEYAGSWHRLGRKAFEERYGIDVDREIARLNGAWADR